MSADLVKGLRNALKGGKKGVCAQPSFGQLLADCPMSTDNKVHIGLLTINITIN